MIPEEANHKFLRSAPDEENDEYLRGSNSMKKRQNDGTGIDRCVIYFDGKTYNPGKPFFMRYQESKDETDSFMKVETNFLFTQMSTKAVIK